MGALAVALASATLGGCAGWSDASSAARAAERLSAVSCMRQSWASTGAMSDPAPAHAARAGTITVPGFSDEAAATAARIGALPQLERHAALRAQPAGRSADELLQRALARQRIADRVLLALLDVQGVVAELECERDRGARLAFVLGQQQARHDRRFALSGLAIGAATAIASGGLALAAAGGRAADVAGIVGGSAEAAVGATGLAGDAEATLRMERNLLAEVWAGPARTRMMPPSVWRILIAPGGEDGTGPSIRDELVAQWRADAGLDALADDARRRRVEQLFGAGGRYSPDALQLRAALIDALQARVWLISMDLERLLREVLDAGGDEPGR